jgi:hypothetical protein
MRKPSFVVETFPTLCGAVLDTTNARALAEFYRQLLGYSDRPGDAPSSDEPDERGADWLVVLGTPGSTPLAFQHGGTLGLCPGLTL